MKVPPQFSLPPALTSQKISPSSNLHLQSSVNAAHLATKLQDNGDQQPGVRVSLNNKPIEVVVYDPKVDLKRSVVSNQQHLTGTSHQLMQQLDDFGFRLQQENRFDGIGKRFGELMQSGESFYQQELRQYQYQVSKFHLNETVDFSEFEIKKEHKVQDFDLSLTLKSGVKVDFQLQSFSGLGSNPKTIISESEFFTVSKPGISADFNRTEINFNIEGDLSKEEQKQLEQFAEKLEAFASGYLNGGKPSLQDLDLSSFDALNELSLNGTGGGQSDLSLKYVDNDELREISLAFDGNKAEISIDKTQQLRYHADGRQQALEHYLTLLDDSSEEAKADEVQQHMMEDVFAGAFELSEEEILAAEQQQQEYQQQVDNGLIRDDIHSEQAFVPLSDFDFSFSSRKDDFRVGDTGLRLRGFELELSLTNQQQQTANEELIQQTQHFALKGTYTEEPDEYGIGFQQTHFNIQTTNTITTANADGELKNASVETQYQQQRTVEDFNFDQLVKTETEESEHNTVKNLIDNALLNPDEILERKALSDNLLQRKNQQLQSKLLDQVLIDPFSSKD